ncbi:hypothetical protein B5E91_09800 [Thomasclavelia spiroformis]|uniref:FRG domain-containing protein n=2 Tax=Thomasclavelia spiroformis TaxID=29348 RepID=A0A1Y4QGM2_9FIRM|nr:FRG domain-containing protein [Thomasclavelia spiroformis]OUQ04435.1 hypothetical protein B5E91_09800 [Thomasclavelia spiroformis]
MNYGVNENNEKREDVYMGVVSSYLDKITEEIEFLQKKHYKKYDSRALIAFRGEPRDFMDTKLMPSIFREPPLISKEKHLFELFCDYELIEHNKRNIDKAIETQHYASISRMLDVTFNAAVALYFACSNNEDDGFVYVFCFPKYYSPHSNYIEDFYTDILKSKEIKTYFKNFKVFSHTYSNDRIKAQSGGFIFFPGDTYSPINHIYYKRIEIKKEDKEKILEELDVIFHINKARLFPEKDKIVEIITEKFMQNDYLLEELTIKSELESCYRRISYEINMFDDIDKINKLRYLRKEKEDLLMYIKKQFLKYDLNSEDLKKDIGEFDSLIEDINKKFDFYMSII